MQNTIRNEDDLTSIINTKSKMVNDCCKMFEILLDLMLRAVNAAYALGHRYYLKDKQNAIEAKEIADASFDIVSGNEFGDKETCDNALAEIANALNKYDDEHKTHTTEYDIENKNHNYTFIDSNNRTEFFNNTIKTVFDLAHDGKKLNMHNKNMRSKIKQVNDIKAEFEKECDKAKNSYSYTEWITRDHGRTTSFSAIKKTLTEQECIEKFTANANKLINQLQEFARNTFLLPSSYFEEDGGINYADKLYKEADALYCAGELIHDEHIHSSGTCPKLNYTIRTTLPQTDPGVDPYYDLRINDSGSINLDQKIPCPNGLTLKDDGSVVAKNEKTKVFAVDIGGSDVGTLVVTRKKTRTTDFDGYSQYFISSYIDINGKDNLPSSDINVTIDIDVIDSDNYETYIPTITIPDESKPRSEWESFPKEIVTSKSIVWNNKLLNTGSLNDGAFMKYLSDAHMSADFYTRFATKDGTIYESYSDEVFASLSPQPSYGLGSQS